MKCSELCNGNFLSKNLVFQGRKVKKFGMASAACVTSHRMLIHGRFVIEWEKKLIFRRRKVKNSWMHHFQIDHNAPCLPLKILHNHCLTFLLGRLWYPGEIGDNGCAKFWALNKVHYGLWEMANSRIHPGSRHFSGAPNGKFWEKDLKAKTEHE